MKAPRQHTVIGDCCLGNSSGVLIMSILTRTWRNSLARGTQWSFGHPVKWPPNSYPLNFISNSGTGMILHSYQFLKQKGWFFISPRIVQSLDMGFCQNKAWSMWGDSSEHKKISGEQFIRCLMSTFPEIALILRGSITVVEKINEPLHLCICLLPYICAFPFV